MNVLVRRCPRCSTLRAADEFVCMNKTNESICGWDLSEISFMTADLAQQDSRLSEDLNKEGKPLPLPLKAPTLWQQCSNGHIVEQGDLMCLHCGAPPVTEATPTEQSTVHGTSAAPGGSATSPPHLESNIDDWLLLEELPRTTNGIVRWRVAHERFPESAYPAMVLEIEESPDFQDQSAIRIIENAHHRSFATPMACGTSNGMRYRVWNEKSGTNLQEASTAISTSAARLAQIVEKLGQLLADLGALGVRHRDLRPQHIRIPEPNLFEPVLCGFHFAVASDFDLDMIALPQTSRYSAPEAHLGAVSPCSDWWSLGIILLELVTEGRCFSGVDDKVFLLTAVTCGVDLPQELDDSTYALLSGLLQRAPRKRWQWAEVQKWLRGDFVHCDRTVTEDNEPGLAETGASLSLAGKNYRSLQEFALRAATADNRDEALDLFRRGELATRVEQSTPGSPIAAFLRELRIDNTLPDSIKLSLALLALNENIPLTIAGEIVTPAWLLANVETGTNLLNTPAVMRLKQLSREQWLQDLAVRATTVRQKIETLAIPVNDERLNASLLCTSRRTLENQWRWLRSSFPDTEHRGLLSLIEKRTPTEEDLIVLVSTSSEEFATADEVLKKAEQSASSISELTLDTEATRALLEKSRRELLDELDIRLSGFACCGIAQIDEWADTYRMERRISLVRALVMMSVPAEQWRPLPKQEYVGKIIEFLERKVSASIQRGPLVRLATGRTSTTIDLLDFDGPRRSTLQLLEGILARTGQSMEIDPSIFAEREDLEQRMRRLAERTTIFRRETGRHSLYLGFPIVSAAVRRADRTVTRVAPLILWPVKLDMSVGNREKIALAFDRDHDEVRLNPALDTALNWSVGELDKWREALNDLLGRSTLSCQSLLDAFALLCQVQGGDLVAVPDKDYAPDLNKKIVTASGALFHCDFAGKAIADDLRNITNRNISHTALEIALRIKEEPLAQLAAESALHHVIETDPSQERAIVSSRHTPGLHIEGPPGTGKSQTIVNIIADTIARGETAIVVCQKQAALSVVEKRLRAEGLGDRLFLITDVTKDRQPFIRALREQLGESQAKRIADHSLASRERDSVVARLRNCERELATWHQALYSTSDTIGLSYRQVLCDLIALAEFDPVPEIPQLRRHLRSCSQSDLAIAMEEAASVAKLWLASKYEQSALAAMGDFLPHLGDVELLNDELDQLMAAEEHRIAVCDRHPDSPDVDDTGQYQVWLKENEHHLRHLPQEVCQNLAAWFALFSANAAEPSQGVRIMNELKEVRQTLAGVASPSFKITMSHPLSSIDDSQLQHLTETARKSVRHIGFFSFADLPRIMAQKFVGEFLKKSGAAVDGATKERDTLHDCELEIAIRPLRLKLKQIAAMLQLPGSTAATVQEMQLDLTRWLSLLEPVAEAAKRIGACPAAPMAEKIICKGPVTGVADFFNRIDGVIQRHAARTTSKLKLDQLSRWLDPNWHERYCTAIANGHNSIEQVRLLRLSTDGLISYQQFRNRAKTLHPQTLSILAQMRSAEEKLRAISSENLSNTVRVIIQMEAARAWKETLEVAEPLLCLDRSELDARIQTLKDCNAKLVQLNRRLLAQPGPEAVIAAEREWEPVTRLTGQRARRLREVVEAGLDLGLMKLRPVWLMNPEVVSRLLPLKANMFDVVIFDEASQLPVEYSIPSLYRAKRFVVSGDDKQMPPSHFFATRIDSDEDELVDSFDDDQSEELKERIEESWNRRDIKDCPNILNLAAAVLPASRLEVHYRSTYSQLIQFSNEAFYAGKLSVASRHTEAQIRQAKPIEVIFADTLYEKQTNPGEAERVVQLLKDIWLGREETGRRPTIGVATFNLKQADLITDLLEKEARINEQFKAILQSEYDREENGEDLSFFVKNLENVQGDERDYIIFSTTFGKNREGKFVRNFGKLGQFGGERRLNVAVTRAKEKVIVVTSMPISEISDFITGRRTASSARDYLQAYLEYAARCSADDPVGARALLRLLGPSRAQTPALSDRRGEADRFVAAVSEHVQSLGYKVTVGREKLDAFSIDIAVEHPGTGMYCFGIECDSPVHELLVRPSHREIWRRKMLSTSLGTVHRIGIRDWYHNETAEKAALTAALQNAVSTPEEVTV